MAIIGLIVVPGSIKAYREKRNLGELTVPWWNPLNIQQAFYNAQWISIITPVEQDGSQQLESKLSLRLSIVGLILMPISILALVIGIKSRKLEQKNRRNLTAIIISSIGIGLGILTYVVLCMVNLESIGLDVLF
ncbi:MAG: hypothetical protein ACTSRD_13175 [Promethearchaeota archaeon]